MQALDHRDDQRETGLPQRAPSASGRNSQISLAAAPESAKAARDFTIAIMRDWSLDSLTSDTLPVVSELVANAIRHGTTSAQTQGYSGPVGPVGLSWRCHASSLICTVTDRSIRPPVLTPVTTDAETGRGLHIVHALAAAWGWRMLSPCGKAVWAAFQLPDADAATIRSVAPGLIPLSVMMRL